jgi:hypothetical protein
VIWWVVLAIVVVSLLILAVTALRLLSGLRQLTRLGGRLRIAAEQAKRLQEPIGALQQRVDDMQPTIASIQERIAARKNAGEASADAAAAGG